MAEIRGRRVFVAGHRGMVGSACLRRLERESCEVVTAPRETLDLRDQAAVHAFMERNRPDVVIVAAARVGGILANSAEPASFLHDNLMIQANLVEAAHCVGVEKLLLLGSSAAYPAEASQPITEGALLTGPLDPSHEGYAVAKIAGVKLAQAYRRQHGADFISAMPTNLYGPNDHYHPTRSHVVAGLIRRFHEARVSGAGAVICWGTGRPRRELLYADDLADACVFLLRHYSDPEPINVGTGTDVTIAELAELVAEVTGYHGRVEWDHSKPDGVPLKRLDVGRLERLGWRAATPLREGLVRAYDWFLRHEVRA